MNKVINNFFQLCNKANTIMNQTFDCRKVEPIYIEILNLVKSNPGQRDQFIDSFLSVLKSGEAPWELIQFCMRELKWDEIKDSIFAELQLEIESNKDWRAISVLENILAVYEDEWEDADLYEYFSKKNK